MSSQESSRVVVTSESVHTAADTRNEVHLGPRQVLAVLGVEFQDALAAPEVELIG